MRKLVGLWPVRLAWISVRGLVLVATQMLMFLFAGIRGSATVVRRREKVAGDYRHLIRAGVAAHGG